MEGESPLPLSCPTVQTEHSSCKPGGKATCQVYPNLEHATILLHLFMSEKDSNVILVSWVAAPAITPCWVLQEIILLNIAGDDRVWYCRRSVST